MSQRIKSGRFPKGELSKGYFTPRGEAAMEHVRAAACQGKFAFNSYEAAAKSIRRVGRTKGQASRIGPYRCSMCGQYHVGSRMDIKV